MVIKGVMNAVIFKTTIYQHLSRRKLAKCYGLSSLSLRRYGLHLLTRGSNELTFSFPIDQKIEDEANFWIEKRGESVRDQPRGAKPG